MKSFVNAILEAETVSTKVEKFKALENLSDYGQALVEYALNPYRVYGVKKFDMPPSFANDDSESPETFLKLLDDLASRRLTGNAARTAVTKTLSLYTEETSNILCRVLDKDLSCGATATTFNKLYPNLVPVFSVMLAKKIDEDYEWVFPKLAEAKYDGERTIAICQNGKVLYLSRSGKVASHCDGLFDNDLIALEKEYRSPIVIDGERYAGDFTTTMNAKKEGKSKAKDAMRLFAFDFMSLTEWQNQHCESTQLERRKVLEILLNKINSKKIHLSKGKIVNSYAEVKDYYNEALKEGFEGLIIKEPNGLYEWDRSKNWNKWKPLLDLDGVVVGIYAGRPGSKYEFTLGGIQVEGEDENGKKFTTNIGSGFSDEMRDEIFSNADAYIGKTVQFEGQELSKAANSEYYSVRFPVFVRFRDDK